MLRTFGVENVSILAGGTAGWQRDELPLEQGVADIAEGEFDGRFDPQVIKRLTDVLLVSHEDRRRSSMRVRPRGLMAVRMNRVRGYVVAIFPARLTCRGAIW